MDTARYSTFNFDLSENVAYNMPSFPAYLIQGVLSLYPDYTGNTHWHEDLEFIIIMDGKMTYSINGELIELISGSGICVNSRQLHYCFSPDKEDCNYLCILLHPSLLSGNQYFANEYVHPFIHNTNQPYIYLDPSISWGQQCITLLMEIFDSKKKEMAPFSIQRHFFHVFELLYFNSIRYQEHDLTASVNLDTLKSMLLFIQENFSDSVSLSDIAKAGSCCKSRCSELFNRYLKESPITYTNKYRLKISCDLLNHTELSITDIALECGFSGASYFCEIFHKYYGITPLQYRKHI